MGSMFSCCCNCFGEEEPNARNIENQDGEETQNRKCCIGWGGLLAGGIAGTFCWYYKKNLNEIYALGDEYHCQITGADNEL